MQYDFRRLIFVIYLIASVYFYVGVFGLNNPPEDLVIGSHNRISSVFLAIGILLYFVDKKLKPHHSLNIFIICVISQGSAGIISSFLLLIFVYMNYYKGNLIFWTLFIASFTSIFLFILSTITEDAFLFETLMKLDWGRLTGEDIRFQIISSYISQMNDSFINFFSGVKDWTFTGESSYNNEISSLSNVHNSYLDAHLAFGIFGIIYIIFLLVILCKTFFVSKFYAFIYLVILIRAFADTNFITSGYYNFAIIIFLTLTYKDYFIYNRTIYKKLHIQNAN